MIDCTHRGLRPAVAVAFLALGACTTTPAADSNAGRTASRRDTAPGRAIVIVSGGAAQSPYTSPTESCREGLAAGNTDTALREGLLKAGYRVYTSPAQAGAGQISATTGFGAFAKCPEALPAAMTVDANGDIDAAGTHLAAFLTYLHDALGVDSVDVVAHSMGGLYSRAAIRELKAKNWPVRVRSLTTLGTPWLGSFAAEYANDKVALAACSGESTCEAFMKGFRELKLKVATTAGSAQEVIESYLVPWNARQAGVLDGIPVALVGGSYFTHEGGTPQVWPNDGLVTQRSALAADVPAAVLPHRVCLLGPWVHSIYFAQGNALDWSAGMTWNPAVLDSIVQFIDNAPQSLKQPDKGGCPAPG